MVKLINEYIIVVDQLVKYFKSDFMSYTRLKIIKLQSNKYSFYNIIIIFNNNAYALLVLFA